jgi:hypothetical protein
VRQVLSSLTSSSSLEFKLPMDTDFTHKYPHIVRQQEEGWRKRLEELKVELNLPREQAKASGSEEVKKAATRRGRLASVKLEPVEPVTVLPATLTPVQAEPMDTSAPQHRGPSSVGESMEELCREVLAQGVHSLSEITNRLRVHQVPACTDMTAAAASCCLTPGDTWPGSSSWYCCCNGGCCGRCSN